MPLSSCQSFLLSATRTPSASNASRFCAKVGWVSFDGITRDVLFHGSQLLDGCSRALIPPVSSRRRAGSWAILPLRFLDLPLNQFPRNWSSSDCWKARVGGAPLATLEFSVRADLTGVPIGVPSKSPSVDTEVATHIRSDGGARSFDWR